MYPFLLFAALIAWTMMPAVAQETRAVDAANSLPLPAVVESGAPMTLQIALGLALRVNPQLSAARREVDAVDASVKQAGALPNPFFEVTAEGRQRDTRTVTWQLSQPLELGGKRGARVAAARREHDAAAAELVAIEADIRASVITAFFDVAAAQERQRLTQASVDIARHATDVAARRVVAGKISPVEETKAKIAQASVQLELMQANAELSGARRNLSALWGNSTPRFERVDGQLDMLPTLPEPTAVDRRIGHAPSLVKARAEVERRDSLTELERRRRIPDVTLSVGMKREEEFNRRQAVIGISLPLPLFDRNSGNLQEALHRADKARDELSTAQIRIDNDVAHAHERLVIARDEVQALRQDILPGADSAYEAVSKGFEYGKFNFLDVLDAQRTLLQARSRYLRALSDAHRSAADLDRLLGNASIPQTISSHTP